MTMNVHFKFNTQRPPLFNWRRLASASAGVVLASLTLHTATLAGVADTSDAERVRFLNQATFGATPAELQRMRNLSAQGWLNAQFQTPISGTQWTSISTALGAWDSGLRPPVTFGTPIGKELSVNQLWQTYIEAPDQLRKRVAAALLEMMVVNARVAALGINRNQLVASGYVDMLEANAFGNFRNLLEGVTLSPAMGNYLSHIGNDKATYDENGVALTVPDENFAREILQLFTIGLYQLNNDGTPKLINGAPIETYKQTDIFNLARVFTGWDYAAGVNGQERLRRPMTSYPALHSPEAKTFLGATIPAQTGPVPSLKRALDVIFAHPNVGPFVGRQLIQRLTSSNPSPAYVNRVASAFNNNGQGVRGDMKAVISAILLDNEASPSGAPAATQAYWGKVREPMVRMTAVARVLGLAYSGPIYPLSNVSDSSVAMGQSPLKSPSVFNFFRPGYTPPNSALSVRQLVAPEFQILAGTSVPGAVNFMANFVSSAPSVFTVSQRGLLESLAAQPANLVNHLNLLLTAQTLTSDNLSEIVATVAALPASNAWGRVTTALTMMNASPNFLVQK